MELIDVYVKQDIKIQGINCVLRFLVIIAANFVQEMLIIVNILYKYKDNFL